MKLKHQVGLLLGIPLFFQAVFGIVMTSLIVNLSFALSKEADAKKILACCQSIREIQTKYSVMLVSQRYTDQSELKQLQEKSSNELTQIGQQLHELLRNDPTSLQDLADYENCRRSFDDTMRNYLIGNMWTKHQAIMGRFLREGDCLEELMSNFNRMMHDEMSITKRYKPVVTELQPASQHGRELLLAVSIGVLIGNVLLFAALGFFFSRYTVSRLKQLMHNIHAFGKGNLSLAKVTGSDELAELNEKFSEMAMAKAAAEEQRRALYGMVSHDLRSPLTSMTLTLGTVLDSPLEIHPRVRTSLMRVLSESKRLVRLSSSFLDGQKLEAGKLQLDLAEHDPRDIAAQSFDALLAGATLKSIKLEQLIEFDGSIVCDADRIVQVLVNLLSNAVKFAPSNSTVTVRFSKNGDTVIAEVIDSGSKLTEEQTKQLFEPFSQLSEGQSHSLSTGLGLYLCRLLVDAHGGELGYRDVDDKKCFWFTIPCPIAGAQSKPGGSHLSQPPPESAAELEASQASI